MLYRGHQNIESVLMTMSQQGQMWPFPNCNVNLRVSFRAGLGVCSPIPSRPPHAWARDVLLVRYLEMGCRQPWCALLATVRAFYGCAHQEVR